MFFERQKLDMSESMLDGIVSELGRHLAISQRAIAVFSDAPPRTQMNFINRKGLAPCLSVLSLIHPGAIAEFVFRIEDNRRSARRDFHHEGVRIGLEKLLPARLDLVLVEFALAQAGNEKFPHA